ncbi:D-alanyl-D-alanine carboxypeptidase family protein [Bacillus sp. AFS031507]|uniref:M15 family metallopeptidase n=1 Tax=Bacillus sp. AFS031507 TaxID=2033496 RepID=UPI00211E1FFB|nr:M15 family metallopeptidase [Bacillus sp. AFS031507]
MIRKNITVLLMFFLIISLTGCNKKSNESSSSKTPKINQMNISNPTDKNLNKKRKTRISAVALTPYPSSIATVVNKKYYLPVTYVPKNLVFPEVPFLFKEKIEKRKMRWEAAKSLEKMFAAAKNDGIYLSGVSAYRSYSTQKVLFNNYVKSDGFEKAVTYSAIPGTSEHQTGLAIDVSGTDGICAVSSCFGNRKEANWLSKNSANYGFIVRYPKGKESITGYKHEPWHLRYVGNISKPINNSGITLEEYLGVKSVSK